MLKESSLFFVAILNLIIAGRYCWLIEKKKIEPALAMWLFFTLAVGISLTTYLSEGNFSIWDNILNTSDLVMVATVAIYIIFRGEKSSRFNKFDLACLIAVTAIVLFWIITFNHLLTNIAIQAIMVIAYFPVIKRMISAKRNTEPFSVWIAIFSIALVSLLTSKGFLANVYVLRAIICTAVLLVLMLRIELKVKKTQKISSID